LDLSNAVKIKKENLSLRLKDRIELGEILISMSGTIGSCCHIRNQIDAFINQRIMKLRPVNFSGDVLALIINSDIGKMQLQRVGTGGVQTNLANSDILNIKIPMLSLFVQKKISRSIHQSLDFKHQSKQLLEIAKTGVERAIETDEATAMT
jgi:restriction endonuclease S subunit